MIFAGCFSAATRRVDPRDAVKADASWRLSDNTLVLADMSFNLDRGNLQTLASACCAARHEAVLLHRQPVYRRPEFQHHKHPPGLRNHDEIMLDIDQEFDFTQGQNVYSSLAMIRKLTRS